LKLRGRSLLPIAQVSETAAKLIHLFRGLKSCGLKRGIHAQRLSNLIVKNGGTRMAARALAPNDNQGRLLNFAVRVWPANSHASGLVMGPAKSFRPLTGKAAPNAGGQRIN
jgi:hypothetical protein